MQLIYAGMAGGVPGAVLSGVTDLDRVAVGGDEVVLALARAPGAVVGFRTDAGGALAYAGEMALPAALSPLPAAIDWLEVGGSPRLAVSGTTAVQPPWAALSAEGVPQPAGALPAGAYAGGVARLCGVTTAEGSHAYLAPASGEGLRVWRQAATGFVELAALPDRPGLYARGITALQPVDDAAGNRWLVVASGAEHGVSALRIGPDGALSAGGSLGAAEGLGLGGPAALALAAMGEARYLLCASGGSSTLTVMRLLSDGMLIATDHVADSAATRFQGAAAVDSINAAGRTFVACGGSDGGFSLFGLLPDGTLFLHRTVEDTAALGLAQVAALSLGLRGDTLDILAAGGSEPGLTRVGFSLAALAAPVTGGSGADDLAGGADDDLIFGDTGDDSIDGGGGDDILLDGAGADSLRGGAGRDVFVLAADGTGDQIVDFDPALDRLDLSRFRGLYALDQVAVEPTAEGALLRYGAEVLRVDNALGGTLTAADFRAAGVVGLARAPLPAVPPARIVEGGEGPDYIGGTEARDLLRGHGGDDNLDAGAGDDTLHGGDGADTLLAGAGDDRVMGGAGDDTALAGDGNDLVQGEAGSDVIYAGAGTDRIWAGDDRDTIHGEAGTDSIWGEAGDDLVWAGTEADGVWGGAGIDTLHGEAGNDLMAGGDGGDLVYGEAGMDTVYGEAGADTLWGGSEADALYGGLDADRVLGEAGADSLWGGAGADDLYGGLDADRFWGGTEGDRIWGEAGADSIWGEAGDDLVWAGSEADGVWGGAGIDTLHGEAGNDLMAGGDGGDLVYGEAGMDTIYGEAGADTIWGGDEADALYGGLDADRISGDAGTDGLWGGGGADSLFAGTGIDTLWGGDGDDLICGEGDGDILWGEAGGDRLWSGNGDDTLWGGAGADGLFGEGGADRLAGDGGNDTLTGGAGADVFVFATGSGQDRITDFTPGETGEVIDLTAFDAISGWADLQANYMAQSGVDLRIDLGGGDVIVIANLGLAALDAGDFLF